MVWYRTCDRLSEFWKSDLSCHSLHPITQSLCKIFKNRSGIYRVVGHWTLKTLQKSISSSGHSICWKRNKFWQMWEIIWFIQWRSISMRAGPASLQFDWSKAGLSMDLPVLVYSHTKTRLTFFKTGKMQDSFLCGSFNFKPRRKNITGLFVLSRLESVKVRWSSRS